jgi:hypothetical protein
MPNARPPIFRQNALKQLAQRREQDILPQIISPPFFTFVWLLLLFLLTAGLFLWTAQIPTYQTVSGVITHQLGKPKNDDSAMALIFFPTSSLPKTGEIMKLQIGSSGPLLTKTISQVDSTILSPADIRKKYALDSTTGPAVTQPSRVVVIALEKDISAHSYAGSTVNAQIQVGTQSILSQIFNIQL